MIEFKAFKLYSRAVEWHGKMCHIQDIRYDIVAHRYSFETMWRIASWLCVWNSLSLTLVAPSYSLILTSEYSKRWNMYCMCESLFSGCSFYSCQIFEIERWKSASYVLEKSLNFKLLQRGVTANIHWGDKLEVKWNYSGRKKGNRKHAAAKNSVQSRIYRTYGNVQAKRSWYTHICVISMAAAANMSSKLIVKTVKPNRKWIVNKVITYGF